MFASAILCKTFVQHFGLQIHLGVILKIYVKKGDEVKRGDPLCVLVAMKMENEIRSVTDGVVKEVFVEDGMKVGLNDRIMVIE